MQNFSEEDSQIAPSSHAEISNTPGLVASPPQRASSRDGRLVGRTTGHLQPTQAHADMFLTLKARLEVLPAWIYWYLYVRVIETEMTMRQQSPNAFPGMWVSWCFGYWLSPARWKTFPRTGYFTRRKKHTWKGVRHVVSVFSAGLHVLLIRGSDGESISPHPPLIDAENGPSTRAVDSSREQDRSSAALQQTPRAGKHKITPRIRQDTWANRDGHTVRFCGLVLGSVDVVQASTQTAYRGETFECSFMHIQYRYCWLSIIKILISYQHLIFSCVISNWTAPYARNRDLERQALLDQVCAFYVWCQ